MDRFEPIFEALNATGVRYVVVGGLAVNLHGHQRFTKDVDVVIELLPERTEHALEALRAIGYEPRLPVRLAEIQRLLADDPDLGGQSPATHS